MFNLKNPTEQNFVRLLAYGEGVISRADILAVSNKTMLSKFKSQGYLRQMKNAEKGVYEVTKKFQQDYRRFDPKHSFSGSHSVVHSSGLNRILKQIPASATLQTGQSVQDEFKRDGRTDDFYRAMSRILQERSQEVDEYASMLQTAVNEREEAAILAMIIDARAKEALCAHPDKQASTPDIGLSLTREDFMRFLGETMCHYLDNDYPPFLQALYDVGIARLEAMEEQGGSAHFYIEIVTEHYSGLDIAAKENWSEGTRNTVVYLPAR